MTLSYGAKNRLDLRSYTELFYVCTKKDKQLNLRRKMQIC